MNGNRVAQFEVIPTAKEAWAKVSGCKMPILLAAIACAVVQMIIQTLCGKEVVGQIVSGILSLLVVMPAYAGLMYMGLQRVRGLPVTFNQVIYAYRQNLLTNVWLYYLCVYVVFIIGAMICGVVSIIPVIGLILMVAAMVGILYVLARFSLGIYFILDRNEKAIDALKHSYVITRAYVWKLMLAYLLIFAASILGFVTLLIGLIWVIPFGYIYMGSIYQAISGNEAR